MAICVAFVVLDISGAKHVAIAQIYHIDGSLIADRQEIILGPGIDLNGRELEYANLRGQDLTGATFQAANLQHARFDGAKLAETNFRAAQASNTFWGGVDLERASLESAELRGASFFGHVLDQRGSSAKSTSFRQANLTDASFDKMDLRNADFTEAQLAGARIARSRLSGAQFEDSDIRGASFRGNIDFSFDQLVSTATFKEKRLQNVELQTDLSGIDLSGFDLSGANFEILDNANLRSSNLTGGRIESAVNADLTGANLTRAELYSLNNADLTDANISGALLAGAQITAEQLYSTSSYQQRDLRNVGFAAPWMSLAGWNLEGQDLSGAWLVDCDLASKKQSGFVGDIGNGDVDTMSSVNFTDAHIVGVQLGGATDIGFSKEQLYSTASYHAGNLERIGLAHNDLQGWDFSGQNLFGANFRFGDSSLFHPRCKRTNVSETSFTNAVLAGAVFGESNVTGADFQGTDLRGADLSNATGFATARFSPDTTYNQWTLFPTDFDPQAAGLRLVVSPDGDFNSNGILDAGDIDLLSSKDLLDHNPSVATNRPRTPTLDLNGDSREDDFDRKFWVHSLAETHFGDANLDGEFNSHDLLRVLQAGKFELGLRAGWAEGDWNGDGQFNSFDVVAALGDGGYQHSSFVAVGTVPEPTSLAILLLGLVALVFRQRDRPISGAFPSVT